MQSTTAAAETFSKKISLWIKELQTYAKTCPGITCRSSKAAAFTIKHRAANRTYSESLTKFGQFPSMDTLGAVYKGRPPKSRIFKPPPLPLSGCVRISKTTPPPRTSASGFFNFYNFYTFFNFYTFLFLLIKTCTFVKFAALLVATAEFTSTFYSFKVN